MALMPGSPRPRRSRRSEVSSAGHVRRHHRFRALKEGHAPATKTSTIPAACPMYYQSVSFFSLELDAPPVDLERRVCGDVPRRTRMHCSPRVNAHAKLAATIERSTAASRFNVSLLDPSVCTARLGGIEINVARGFIAVSLGSYPGSPGLVERVADNTYISFDGEATASVGRPPASTVATSLRDSRLVELPPGSASVVATGKYVCPAAARVQCFSGSTRSP